MMTLALLLTGLVPAVPGPDTTFWDNHWQRVSRANGVYYGWTAPLDSGRCRIQTFYVTGERQMEATGCPGPPVMKDGLATYYYSSGTKSAAGHFANGKREGIWRYWQPNGVPSRELTWHGGVAVRHPSLADDHHVRQLVEQMPRFPGPLSVWQYLAATMHRPATTPAGGGKVYVEFVVGEQGNVTSTRIVKSFSPDCDAEALRAVAALPRWQPGRENGSPVPVSFTIPITFL